MRGINSLFARHRLLLAVLVASTLIGAVCAKLNASGRLEVAAASTHVMIDDPDASIVDRMALPQDLATLQKRAELYARLMTTPPLLDAIGKRAGVPGDQIYAMADITAGVPIQFTQAGSEERADQIRGSRLPYRLELQSDPYEPTLAIYSEAPSIYVAQRLADSAILGLRDYLRTQAQAQGLSERQLPRLRQLGPARGDVTNAHARIVIAGLTFVTAFVLSFVSLFVLARRPWRRREDQPQQRPDRSTLSNPALGDWPRTTRLLPWSVAVLIAMIWLTPFDRIQLTFHAPINITLDRIVLPIVVLIWLIAFTAGSGAAPRLRLTRVHAAVAAFLTCAFLSTVLDAGYLNHVGELMLSLKKLPLLVSYLSIFVIVSSSVRRSEVPAFMTYSLVLAVIVGLGVIYEYRFHQNLFNTLSRSLFRGPFSLVSGDPENASLLDVQGRRWVQGPAISGLELVTMLSLALPIGVLGILKAKTRAQYLRYGLAIAILLYAMLATDRKSALIAPAAVFLTIAYFRRRQLISLAPLVLVVAVIAAAASPAAIHTVVAQFTSPNAGKVATVSSRTANYDAIRPDLWAHLLLGRGQGTYAPPTDRIVDSEIILRLVETGVLGLLTFLLIPFSLIWYARRTVAERDPRWSPPALCGVAAGVCFIVVSTLYSVMIVPHGPDVFLYIAGLAVAVGAPNTELPRPSRRLVHVATQHEVAIAGRRRLRGPREPAIRAR